MKVVYLAEIMWITETVDSKKEKFNSIVEDFDRNDTKKIREIARYKFKKALEYIEQENNVILLNDREGFISGNGHTIKYSQGIKVKDSYLVSAYMEVSFRPVLKADGWIFDLNPIPATTLFVDSNFKE